MANILSSKLTVFPSVKRSLTKPSARLMSESSLVGIVNKLIDEESFIISTQSVLANDGNSLEFNIFGYYFNISTAYLTLGLATSTYTDIYAHIELTTIGSGDNQYVEMVGQDSTSAPFNFTGLNIDDQETFTPSTTGNVVKTLWIAHK